jgi:hypothetical protein
MSERTAFPDGVELPADPSVPLTEAQLAALFPDRAANQRFVTMLARHSRTQKHEQPLTSVYEEKPTLKPSPVRERTPNGS